MADTPLQAARRRSNSLIMIRKSDGWDAHARELAEHINPWKSRFMASDRNRGNKRGTKILSGHARKANRILSAGMMSGMSNPARPWFNLEPFDTEMLEYQPVKEWLEKVEMVMNIILQRSNAYQTLPNMYTELGWAGTGPVAVMEDFEDVIVTNPFTFGEYAMGVDKKGRCNAFTRVYEDSVENWVKEVGLENVSKRVKRMYDKGDYDKTVEITHLVEVNHDDVLQQMLGMGKNRAFRQMYWETAALDGKESAEAFGEKRGLFEMPIIAPRWDTNSGDIYGNGPGQDALADIKQIQVMEKRKLNKLEKSNNPPMKGPASLRNERTSSLPGDMTYVPDNANTKYEPAYMIDANIESLRMEIAEKKKDIDEYYYVDLFLHLIRDERNQRATATEIAEVHQEKLLMLGPVLNRLNYEGFDPFLGRVYKIAERAAISGGKLLPPPPPEMRGSPISVKYVSILAQAQRLADVVAIEREAQFITTIAGAWPEALDRFDYDNAIDKYQETSGAPVSTIRPLAKAQEIRNARAEAQQQQMAMDQGAQAIDSAKQLSETNTAGRNALADMLGIS